MKTNFEMVAAMNVAFGNPQGNINKVSLSRIKNQVKNIPDEVGELFIALGADKYMTQDAVAHLKWLLAQSRGAVDLDKVRDSLTDIHVFAYGAHHLMGINADDDCEVVVDALFSRFVKDDADKEKTIAKHAAAGVTDVYFIGDYPTMVMKSNSDQPDAPKGKFLKSASYSEPIFPSVNLVFVE